MPPSVAAQIARGVRKARRQQHAVNNRLDDQAERKSR